MRRIAVLPLVAVLALAGCSATASPEPTTMQTATTLADAATLPEVIAYVLDRPAGSMTNDEVGDAASKLNKLAAKEYSDAKFGELKSQLNVLTINAVQGRGSGNQAELVELAKQVRELG